MERKHDEGNEGSNTHRDIDQSGGDIDIMWYADPENFPPYKGMVRAAGIDANSYDTKWIWSDGDALQAPEVSTEVPDETSQPSAELPYAGDTADTPQLEAGRPDVPPHPGA